MPASSVGWPCEGQRRWSGSPLIRVTEWSAAPAASGMPYCHWRSWIVWTWPGSATRSPQKAAATPSTSARKVTDPFVCPGVGSTRIS